MNPSISYNLAVASLLLIITLVLLLENTTDVVCSNRDEALGGRGVLILHKWSPQRVKKQSDTILLALLCSIQSEGNWGGQHWRPSGNYLWHFAFLFLLRQFG